MKSVEQTNIKKICNFYVSDIHLSVMLLPYINNEINEDVEVTTIFEKLEKENFEKILDKINVKNREKILNDNWFNNKITKEKINDILNNKIKSNKKNTIIIGGDKDFILKVNKQINEHLGNNIQSFNMKIIDCYNVEEVGNEMKSIVKDYDGILNTSSQVLNCG